MCAQKSHSKWSQTLFVTTLTFVQKAFKKMIQKTNKNQIKRRMQFTAKNLLCRMTFTFISACLHILYILFLQKRKKIKKNWLRATTWKCDNPRLETLGLGRNRNRNRSGNGGLSGVKLAAQTKAKVMTFWQPNRKCLVWVCGLPPKPTFLFPFFHSGSGKVSRV